MEFEARHLRRKKAGGRKERGVRRAVLGEK